MIQGFYPVHMFVRSDPGLGDRELWFHLDIPWVLTGQFRFRVDALKTVAALAEGAEAVQYSMRLGDAVSFDPGFSEDIVEEFPGLKDHGGLLLFPAEVGVPVLSRMAEEKIERPFSFIVSFRNGCYWKFGVGGQIHVTGGLGSDLFDRIAFKSEEMLEELRAKYAKEIQNA